MYAKTQALPETIKVQSDNGSLRLQFSTKYNPIFGGKRKHQGLGMKDTPENLQKAIAIAWRIEGDLQHPDWEQLFDPTFAKYGLKTKYAAELKLAAPIPEPEPEITVGAMWEDYLVWKRPQVQPTTFEIWRKTFTNALNGLVWDKKTGTFTRTQTGTWEIALSLVSEASVANLPLGAKNKSLLIGALKEAFTRLQSQGKTRLTVNPFVIIGSALENKTDKYKSVTNAEGDTLQWWQIKSDTETDPDERDRRAFTKEERDIIIKAFYESGKPATRQAAPLVEFLFLTGCRSGEAFALRWQDIKLERGYIFFYKSYSTRLKDTFQTKDGVDRLFKIYPKLNEFLLRIKPPNAKPTDLLFSKLNGKSYDSSALGKIWKRSNSWTDVNGLECFTDGIVAELAKTGAIICYLSPYHTRHTFITLMAHHSGIDLVLLGACCGNSADMIQRHYLGINTEADLPDV
ncbi:MULTISPECIES: tyrosine-type recombinase/integrase [unclassified Microcoleus]|uniref:tyrosine-type recombinase/integrase n=1 Tax=unclassified Microcoleus TaxID=2642155 RepID=UPI002FD2C3A4